MDAEVCYLDHPSREPALGSTANWHLQLLYLQIYCDIHARSCFPWTISSHWLNTGEYQEWAIPAWSGHYLATNRPFWLGDWLSISLAETFPELHCNLRFSLSNPPFSLFLTGVRPALQPEGFFHLRFVSPPLSFPGLSPNKSFAHLFLLASVSLRPLTNTNSTRNGPRKQVARWDLGSGSLITQVAKTTSSWVIDMWAQHGSPNATNFTSGEQEKYPMEGNTFANVMIQVFERYRGDDAYENSGTHWLFPCRTVVLIPCRRIMRN